jgi:hypothetical protein
MTDQSGAHRQTTPPSEPAKKRRKWPWIVGGVVVLLVIVIAATAGGGGSSTPAASAPQAGSDAAKTDVDTITYKVTGDGVDTAGSITYVKDSSFSQEQANGEKLPWTTTVQMDKSAIMQPLSLIAQSAATKGKGSITCEIDKNGQKVTSSTSSGPAAVVTCSSTGH